MKRLVVLIIAILMIPFSSFSEAENVYTFKKSKISISIPDGWKVYESDSKWDGPMTMYYPEETWRSIMNNSLKTHDENIMIANSDYLILFIEINVSEIGFMEGVFFEPSLDYSDEEVIDVVREYILTSLDKSVKLGVSRNKYLTFVYRDVDLDGKGKARRYISFTSSSTIAANSMYIGYEKEEYANNEICKILDSVIPDYKQR